MEKKKKTTKSEAVLEAFIYILNFLLQRNEAGRMSGSNTRTTVFNRLVCDGELSKVMTNHLRLKRENAYHQLHPAGSCKLYLQRKTFIHNAFNIMSVIFNGFVGHRVSP